MRGLLAPLSSNEEVTLRRVAMELAPARQLPAAHLKRLAQLNLIEDNKGGYHLTPLGRQRFTGLPRPAAWATDGSPREIVQILATTIRSRVEGE